MDAEDIKARTKNFALRVIQLSGSLPKNTPGQVMGRQVLRAATSVGANYRAALRARSKTEFIAKLGVVVEEADECCYWLDLIIESDLVKKHRLQDLLSEANQLTALFVATIKSAKRSRKS